jgi:hypothetical protein
MDRQAPGDLSLAELLSRQLPTRFGLLSGDGRSAVGFFIGPGLSNAGLNPLPDQLLLMDMRAGSVGSTPDFARPAFPNPEVRPAWPARNPQH